MEIRDLDFKKLLQKPVEETVFACHLDQLFNQELETVVGGLYIGMHDGLDDELCVPDLTNPPHYIRCVEYSPPSV